MTSMSLRTALAQDVPCQCGFELWEPIAQSQHSRLGLYNDDRFPGRSILALQEHRTSIENLPMDTMLGFMRDIQVAMSAIRLATGADRVNVSILGNRDPHVHAHLIPRFSNTEAFPDCSPWNDPRNKQKLPFEEVSQIKARIFEELQRIDTRTSKLDHSLQFVSPLF